MKGTLYGVGVGPGDPELLTLKAARLIESVPVIAFVCNRAGRSRARETAQRHLQPHQLEIPIALDFDSERRSAAVAYADAAKRIASELNQGRNVATLCEGDPLLYASFIYILRALGNIERCRVVPGISSIAAAAASTCTPLVSAAERLAVVPATAGDAAIRDALEHYDCVVIVKAGKQRGRVLELLKASGRCHEGLYISAASHDAEAVVSDLRTLPYTPGPYFALFLVSRHCNRSPLSP